MNVVLLKFLQNPFRRGQTPAELIEIAAGASAIKNVLDTGKPII